MMEIWSETLIYKIWIELGNWLAGVNISLNDILVFCLDFDFIAVALFVFSFLVWKLLDFISFVVRWISEDL